MDRPVKKQKKKKLCMDAALTYLGTRMRSEYEMRSYLQKKQYREDEIEQTIERLKGYGYIDDLAFAKEMIRCKTAIRPMGKRALHYALYKAGVDKDTIEEGLAAYPDKAEQEACDVLCEKLMLKNGTDRQGLAKTQRALAARGFGYEMVSKEMQKRSGIEWE